MIVVYRPELENPPMDKECTVGFSFITGSGDPQHIRITAGVTRDFPEDVWDRIKNYDVVKNLLKLGALKVEENDRATIDPDEEATAEATTSIAGFSITQALDLVEASFDTLQLQQWSEKEQRIKVRNAIAKRISAITEGNG